MVDPGESVYTKHLQAHPQIPRPGHPTVVWLKEHPVLAEPLWELLLFGPT